MYDSYRLVSVLHNELAVELRVCSVVVSPVHVSAGLQGGVIVMMCMLLRVGSCQSCVGVYCVDVEWGVQQ